MFPRKEDLHKRYSNYTTERLLSIFYSKEQYTAQALEVVKSELKRRNITAREVDGFLDEQEAKQRAAQAHFYVPLRFWEKSLFFFAWFTPWFLGKAFRLNYYEDGFLLKAKQSAIFARAGFAFLMLDGFASVYFNLGNLISILVLVLFFLGFCAAEKQFTYDPIPSNGS